MKKYMNMALCMGIAVHAASAAVVMKFSDPFVVPTPTAIAPKPAPVGKQVSQSLFQCRSIVAPGVHRLHMTWDLPGTVTHARIRVHTMTGAVLTQFPVYQASGSILWSIGARRAASNGVYFVSLLADGIKETRMILFTK